MVVQPGLCGTWSETPKTGFLRTRLIYLSIDCNSSVSKIDAEIWKNEDVLKWGGGGCIMEESAMPLKNMVKIVKKCGRIVQGFGKLCMNVLWTNVGVLWVWTIHVY